MTQHAPHVLFIGLGVMGYHMAGHLSKQFPTSVFNRNRLKSDQWLAEFNGTQCEHYDSVDEHINVIVTCIGNDDDLRQVYLADNGLVNTAEAGSLLIDHTTASAQVAREIAAAAELRGLKFIDAPVSGGEQGAINGQLTIMCGGQEGDYQEALPYLNCYAKASNLMGGHGAGQLTKMCNQMAVAGVVQGLSEAIHFAEQADLDAQQVIDVISKGAAQSWQMDNRHKTMIAGEYDHGFAVDWMRKDLAICLNEGRQLNAKLPLTALIDQFYADVQDMGGNRWDTSSLLERLRGK